MTEIPGIKKGKFRYKGVVSLQAWEEFHIINDADDPMDSIVQSGGPYKISLGGDMATESLQIAKAHLKAYEYLVENQDEVQESILSHLLTEYEGLQDFYDFDGEDKLDYMPDVSTLSEFEDLIALTHVYLLNVEKDGIAYVGYQFNCSWDDEHGMGIMTHKNKIINFGGADTAFLSWVAQKDLSNTAEVLKEEIPTIPSEPIEPSLEEKSAEKDSKNAWWKFW